MPLASSEAIVLRKIDYQEADRIITFLTPDHGKLSGIAKGAKRIRSRVGPSLEVLTHGQLVYFDRPGKGLVSINHFDILASFRRVREDLIRSSSCQYLAELIIHFIPEREAAPEVFSLLLKAMHGIAGSRDPEAILRIFEIRFLSLAGFAPKMDACVLCGRTDGVFGFSMKEGGLVCASCGRSDTGGRVSKGVLLFWRQALFMDTEKMDRIRLQGRLNTELKGFVHRYFLHLLGREIRSYNFLERVRKQTGT